MRDMERATRLDPGLAAAHLVLAENGDDPFHSSLASITDQEGQRKHVLSAIQGRATLGERDEALLHALEPNTIEDPPDFAEAASRARNVLSQFPFDAGLAWQIGRLLAEVGRFDEALAAFDQASRLDPKFAAAFSDRATLKALGGDSDGALASVERCLALSPTATSCIRSRDHVYDTRRMRQARGRRAPRDCAGARRSRGLREPRAGACVAGGARGEHR
jgi:eukaryotic-like serine/threonine-protein kinase